MDTETRLRASAVATQVVKEMMEARAALPRGEANEARARFARAQNVAGRPLEMLKDKEFPS